MIVIDPLRQRIHNGLRNGEENILNNARGNYGNDNDVRELLELYSEARMNIITSEPSYVSDSRKYIFIDLTPFDRVGKIEKIITQLNESRDVRPVIMYMSPAVDSQIKAIKTETPIICIAYSGIGNLIDITNGTSRLDNNLVIQVRRDIESLGIENNIVHFRRWIAQQRLTNMLIEGDGLYVPVKDQNSKTIIYTAGRYYKRMPNKMLVSSYIELKKLARNVEQLTEVAYEVILELACHFRRDIDAFDEFDVIVVPNNTALFIASAIQAILEKEVIPIDRLGPVPRLPRQRQKIKKMLGGKKCVVLEEVVATGNELDRTVLFLSDMDVEVQKIIAIYNLEVGKAMIPEAGKLISLCSPKKEINYVYRSD